MNIDEVLSNQDNNYESIKDILENYDEDNYYKILFSINKFKEQDMKKICKKIIINSNNENLVEKACMQIVTFIQYEYEYYKEIIEIISLKKFNGMWINEIKDKLIEDRYKTIVDIFEDFGKKTPQNILYDIEIITRLLDKYNEKYFRELKIKKNKIIESCKRINYITTINVKEMLKMFYYFSAEYRLTLEEIKSFLDIFLKNYPSVCNQFLEKKEKYDNDTDFIKYLQNKMEQYNKEENIKYDMEIFKPDTRRIIEYRKMQLKQNKKMNKEVSKYSFLADIFKSNTILYGRKYGIAVATKDSKKVSIDKLHEYKYEYPLPLEYILDPVEYLIKINELKSLGKGE